MENPDIENLQKLTVVQLKELGKKYKIKGISNKKKDTLVQYLHNEINLKNERNNGNDYENTNNDNVKEEIDNTENNDEVIESVTEKLDEIIIDIKPKYYYLKYDYLKNYPTKEKIESILSKKLNFGDIVQFDDYRANGSFILNNNIFMKCSGSVSEDIFIPLEISQIFSDPISLYKDIHVDFYGIELDKNNKHITDKFGDFEAPSSWKFYYVNQDIFENELHIDIGQDDFIQICFDISEDSNQYTKFINSIEYVKKFYEITSSKYDTYGLYVTLKNNNNDDLNKLEENFLYNVNIPKYSILTIEYQCDYYELRFIYPSVKKEDMIKYIKDYYYIKKYSFVKEIEDIIAE